MKHYLSFALAALLLGSSGSPRAQSPDLERLHFTIGEHVLITLPGRAEVVGGYAQGMEVDVADAESDDALADDLSLFARVNFAPSLLVIGPKWPLFNAYQLSADFDIPYLHGEMADDALLALDPLHAERGLEPLPRLFEARASAVGNHLALSLGLSRSSWGLGMLANDGRPRDLKSGASPFGFSRLSDRVARAQVAAFPLGRVPEGGQEGGTGEPPLTIALAADAVIEDDNADWFTGDRTWHAIGALRGSIAGFVGGIYGVHRWQTHWEGGETEITLVDLYMRHDMEASGVRIRAEVEAAISFGETTYAEDPINPGPQSILAGGGVARLGVSSGGFGLVLEAGYASGDSDHYDGERTAFTFDREYRVGLLMFRESLRKASAVSAFNVADPSFRASPPRGHEKIATAGALRGAIYVNPRVSYDVMEDLTLMAGYLHARSDGPYTDPFQSGLMGGASMGLQGVLQPEDFGHELNLGLEYALKLDALRLRFRGEFAWFVPGDIFERPGPEGGAPDQLGAWLHGEVTW